MHFKLYAGYVKETNRLNEKIAEFLADGKIDQEEMPAYSELTRRLGFEYNGMVLHEYYFGNLKQQGGGAPDQQASFFKAAEASFGSYELWKTDYSSASARCAASAGRCVIKIRRMGNSRIIGSPCTRPATLRASLRCW